MNNYIKHFAFLVLAIGLLSCDGFKKPKTPTEPANQTTTDIAKAIWEKLTTEDPFFSENIATALTFENEYADNQDEPEYLSKTHMKFYRMGDVSEGQIDQVAYYEMQCYPMKDDSWIAVVFGFFNNYFTILF